MREKELEEITPQVVDYERKAKELEQRVKGKEQYIIQIEADIEVNEEAFDREQQRFQELHTTVKESEIELKSLNNRMVLHEQNKHKDNADEIRVNNSNETA